MSPAGNLKDQEEAAASSAGNAEDGVNVGQQAYDEKFNKPAKDTTDEDFDDIIANNYGEDASSTKVDAHGDTVRRNYNADEPDSRDELKDKEENPDSLYNSSGGGVGSGGLMGRLRSGSKKYGASGGIVGLIVGIFGIGATGIGPATLLTNLYTISGNHTDLGNHLYTKTGKSFVAAFFKGETRDCATSKIKCKFDTISDKRKVEWEKRGIKVEADKTAIPGATGDRWKIRGLEFPNGRKVTTIREYNTLRSVDPVAHGLLKRYPIRATYTNNLSSIKKTLTKFNRKIGDKFASSKVDDKKERIEANDKSMDSHTGAVTDEDGHVTAKGIQDKSAKHDGIMDEPKRKIKDPKAGARSAANVANITVVACMAYDVIRATETAMMLLWHEELIKFALPFLQAGSQAKEAGVNDDFDWETAEYYGDRLTHPVTQKEADADKEDNITDDMVGKTAMDSKGMAAALNGDPLINQDYSGWAPISGVMGSDVVKKIQTAVGGGDIKEGKKNIKDSCLAAQVVSFLDLAQCASIPLLLKCVGFLLLQQAAVQIWGDDVVKLISQQLSEPALKIIEKANLSSSLTGPALGDALVSASGVMAGYADRSSGFAVAGNTDDAFVAYRDMVNNEDYTRSKIADARQSSSGNQFDLSDKYSFAGQLVSGVNWVPWDGTLYSVLANITSLPALSGISGASAMQQGIYQPVQVYQSEKNFMGAIENCESPGLMDIEVPCLGESGRAVPMLMTPVKDCLSEEDKGDGKKICIEEAIEYLAEQRYKVNDEKTLSYIDFNTGEPSEWSSYGKDKDDYANPFLMFMRHCGNDRQYPLGYTDKSLGESKLDWYDGKRCASSGDEKLDEDLAWMSYYYNMCIALYASEENIDYCWDDTPAAATPSSGGGDWQSPTTGPCLSEFGQRWGKLHAGIDISPPQGTDIVAPTDMKIISAGNMGDGYGNTVVARATDGSNYMFRFGHMASQPPVSPGQTVTKGTVIGNVGSTGNSTGPHLHFEVYDSNSPDGAYASNGTPLNPVDVLAQHGVNIAC